MRTCMDIAILMNAANWKSENKTEPNLNANVECMLHVISRRERNVCTITEIKTKIGKVLVCETHHVLSARRALPWPK